MTVYQVTLNNNGAQSNIYFPATSQQMQSYTLDQQAGYPSLQRLLSSQKLIDAAARITRVGYTLEAMHKPTGKKVTVDFNKKPPLQAVVTPPPVPKPTVLPPPVVESPTRTPSAFEPKILPPPVVESPTRTPSAFEPKILPPPVVESPTRTPSAFEPKILPPSAVEPAVSPPPVVKPMGRDAQLESVERTPPVSEFDRQTSQVFQPQILSASVVQSQVKPENPTTVFQVRGDGHLEVVKQTPAGSDFHGRTASVFEPKILLSSAVQPAVSAPPVAQSLVSAPKALTHDTTREVNVKPASQSVCSVFAKKTACCVGVALPILAGIAVVIAGDYYTNSGSLTSRLFEQLGFTEEMGQEMRNRFGL